MSDTTETHEYQPEAIEAKWQKFWEENKTFKTTVGGSKKKYILDMFPYPSGDGLHVGHPEGYTATDILSRYYRMNGYDVLHPMGWDAFGLPAEQYALKTGTHPRVTTQKNINNFRKQIKRIGLSYDWDREVDTTDPQYYTWTQWIFLKLFKRGLAYQDEKAVNWCPALGTVLANEEVKDGLSERGGHPVVRTPLRQWMLKITAYSDALLDDLALVDWPEGTRLMQQEWIGRSVGAEVFFETEQGKRIQVFTTRPDTLFGVSFLALAPEHPFVQALTTPDKTSAVEAYIARTASRSDLERKANKEKSGVFLGSHAKHPLTGEDVQIWIADYVLAGYGTGAVMGVPAHDERDFEFAQKFSLPVKQVVSPDKNQVQELRMAFVGEGFAVNSGTYSGLSTMEFKAKVTADLEQTGKGKKRVETKLRDWVFSRQRYWGEPIPVYFPVDTDVDLVTFDPRKDEFKDAYTIRYHEPIAVDESELPLLLPELSDFKPTEDPLGPLSKALDWRFFKKTIQQDGQEKAQWFARETNTMPQWAGSCWYYLRYIDPQNNTALFSLEEAKKWLPVDLYVGGAEHAVLHLLYARFWHKVLVDEGVIPNSMPEPFLKLVHQGMILGEVEYTAYFNDAGDLMSKKDALALEALGIKAKTQKVSEQEVEKKGTGFVLKSTPEIEVDARAHKMSKSRGNVINPDEIITAYGADAFRLYEMFMGPLEASKPWATSGIGGVRRFLERAWNVSHRQLAEDISPKQLRLTHQTIKKVTEEIEAMRFNTAISTLMTFVNELYPEAQPPRVSVEALVCLLSPLAPHISEELWVYIGKAPGISLVPWPSFDPELCKEDEVEIAVQVNGKVRGRIVVNKATTDADAFAKALLDEQVIKYTEGKEVIKKTYVPSKIVTIVVK